MESQATQTAKTITLSSRLNAAGTGGLHSALSDAAGESLSLDASEVSQLGAQCAELLVAAQRSWEAAEQTFLIINPSDAFTEGLARLGFEDLIPIHGAEDQ